VQPEAVELVVLAALALGFAVVFAPPAVPRRALLLKGGAGLVGTAALAAVPTLDLTVLVLLALGVLHSIIDGRRSLAVRLRGPAVAVALLALGAVFARSQGPDLLQRLAAVGLVAGLAAAVGVLPYLHPAEPDEPLISSPVVWLAFVGPVLAIVVTARAQTLLAVDAASAFGSMLIGLGLINVVWGGVAAWLTESNTTAWRYSFVADWGLVLCGLGLVVADGQRAAILALFTIVLGRLPLYLLSLQAVREKAVKTRPVNLVVAAALAGAAPFAGFAARLLLLRAATQLFWPLAIVLAAGMLLWLPGSMRLGRSFGLPRGRQAVGVALVLAVNVAVGLYPLPLLLAARL
jgi:NADH:ubiquinone oxidoreductase subunit 4 (subunit M)